MPAATSEFVYEPVTLRGTVGQSRVRTTGRDKVTGRAPFTADWPIEGDLLYAVAVPAPLACGTIEKIYVERALGMPGVVTVLTPENAPKLKDVSVMTGAEADGSNRTESTQPAATYEVQFAGQFVAAVVAETFEAARDGALAVEFDLSPAEHVTDFEAAEPTEMPPQLFGHPPRTEMGNPDEELAAAVHRIDKTYTTAMNHHNPIEPHAAIADWRESPEEGQPRLTVFETVQSVAMSGITLARMCGIDEAEVRVVNRYIGGAFGSKGGMWPQTPLAVMCSQATGRPVKLTLSRRDLYGGTGHRTPTHQRIALGTDADGRITTVIHEGHAATTAKETLPNAYPEAFTMATRMMYRGEHRRIEQHQSRTHTQQPTFMRAPAEAPGLFALEAAVNELAYDCNLDPVAFRIANEPPIDPMEDKPFSSRLSTACYKAGADQFGWSDRAREPRATTEGDWLIGTGMAAATYPAFHFPTQSRLTVHRDGCVHLACCTQELGTGTRTVTEQLVADLLDLPPDRVRLSLGDSRLPQGGVSGGSATASSVGGAFKQAVQNLREELVGLLPSDSPLRSVADDELFFRDGGLATLADEHLTFDAILKAADRESLSVEGTFKPDGAMPDAGKVSAHSYGATFVEVAVDEALGLVRLRRMLGCYACGTILNRRTARSQFLGGMVMGIGHALMEETRWDHRFGRITNDNIAEYHVPVCADVPDLDVMWISDPDFDASPIGAKGIGEIGITGVAAAIAEAIWHATGKRLTHLPILPHHVMA